MDDPSCIFLPAKPRVPRKRRPVAVTPAVGPLVLASATYDRANERVTLGFNRAIDVSEFITSDLKVADGISGVLLGASGIELLDATTARVQLFEIDPAGGDSVLLNTSEPPGIVAAGDGAAWAGVTDLELPWP